MPINIAIDGPSGAGKSTVAKRISEERGLIYLDTGAMYRAVGLFMRERGVDVSDAAAVVRKLPLIEMEIFYQNGAQRVAVSGEDVTDRLRLNEISMAASTVSKIPEVRLKLVELQRKIAASTDCVLDGRDIGTYVLPDAKYKFFVTASPERRAERRYLELKNRGQEIPFETVLNDIVARDKQDSERDFAPLKAAEDAIVVDNSDLSVDESVAKISGYLWKS